MNRRIGIVSNLVSLLFRGVLDGPGAARRQRGVVVGETSCEGWFLKDHS